ncbi:MAG: NupC/NupG family nucleoside CNT transporter [Opitutales bacterium]
MEILRSIIGIAAFIGIAWALSENRKYNSWRLIASALGLQFVLAFLVLKVPFVAVIIDGATQFFISMIAFANDGAASVFGKLNTEAPNYGTIIGFRVLPAVLFFSALTAVLYYYGIPQKLVYALAWLMSRTMKLSGAESLAAAANVFFGQTQAPLVVKPYLEKMTRSEIMALMTGGFATVSGTLFGAYVIALAGEDPVQQELFGKHLISASILSAPAALLFAKLMVPETNRGSDSLEMTNADTGTNVFDAVCQGTTEGLRLALNVGAMLIVFIAMVTMVNYLIGDVFGAQTGLNVWVENITEGRFDRFSLEFVFGILFAPFAWLIGVNNSDLMVAGQLLGQKMVINEFVAFLSLGELKSTGMITDERSIILISYALCGFSNFASMGIQIGGISSVCPSQRPTICALALKALIAGSLACFATACVAGVFL